MMLSNKNLFLTESRSDNKPSKFGKIALSDMEKKFDKIAKDVVIKYEKNSGFQESLVNPIVIVGIPRTGTTYLHSLLASAEESMSFTKYELVNPNFYTLNFFRKFVIKLLSHVEYHSIDFINPKLKTIHLQKPNDSEEDDWAMAPIFAHLYSSIMFRAYNSTDDILKEKIDMKKAYEFHHKALKLLTNTKYENRDGKVLTLKSPGHYNFVSYLKDEMDPFFVYTHRDPYKSFASFLSLAIEAMQLFAKNKIEGQGKEKAVLALTEMYSWYIENGERQRALLDEEKILDIANKDIRNSPVDVAVAIYEKNGIKLSNASLEKIKIFIKNEKIKQDSIKKHHYSLSDFGVKESDVDQIFANYSKKYSKYF